MRLFNIFKKKKSATHITRTIIRWRGKMHAIDENGYDVNGTTFVKEIPFSNRSSANMLTESNVGNAPILKAQKPNPIKITGVEVAAPFKLTGIEPNVPIEVQSDQSVVLRLNIEAPEHSYNGALNITLNSEVPESTHVELSKFTLRNKGRSVDIENSARIISIEKGQIFAQAIQLYKIVGYRTKVKGLSVEPPFKLVSTDPKPPFEIDNPNSYIVTFYIQPPDVNYAGSLEINVDT